MLRIALPNKGRLAGDVRELFADAGLPIRAASDRALRASLGGEFEALFVRAEDVPAFVADGAAHAGVTGWDLILESGRPLSARLDLGFGRCRLAVAAPKDGPLARLDRFRAGTRVATSFPRLTAGFFAERGLDVAIVPISGAAEIAPHLGIADAIVDLVSTGSTLETNGLAAVATIVESSARFVTRDGESERALDELALALESVLRARGRRYLMTNAPRGALAEVRRVLPGLNGPTVIDLWESPDMVAVHAVVPAADVYRTLVELRALGCEGTLVTRIERLL